MQCGVKVEYILHTLRYLIAESVSIPSTTLPPLTVLDTHEDPYPMHSFSSEQIKDRLTELYTRIPILYRETLDMNFPNFARYMGHFRIYPFKYIVYFGRLDKNLPKRYVLSEIYCLPVASEMETTAEVRSIEDKPVLDAKEEFYRTQQEYVRRLKAFGRYTESNRSLFTISQSIIDYALSDKALTYEVYKLFESDTKRLFGK
jgi:hypothetical protein